MVETVRIRRMDGIVRDKAEPLDLRPFFQESDAAAPEAPAPGVWEGLDDWVPEPPPAQEEPETSVRNRPAPVPPGWMLVSPAVAAEKRREREKSAERARREDSKPWKLTFAEAFLSVMKLALAAFAESCQALERRVSAMKYGGVPFETSWTAEELYYLAVSLPSGKVKTEKDVLKYYPMASRAQRYKMLKIRSDHLASYRKVFRKDR